VVGGGHLSAVSEPDSSFYIRNFLPSHLVHISNVVRREKASAWPQFACSWTLLNIYKIITYQIRAGSRGIVRVRGSRGMNPAADTQNRLKPAGDAPAIRLARAVRQRVFVG